ncbi:MAG: nucleotidyltransferase domain-containing protein [Candidatus Woesearchaeota archaeon]
MKTEQKILVSFLHDRAGKTIRELSKKIKSDYKITHVAVQRLLEKEILIGKIVGKSTLCQLNNTYFGDDIYIAENTRKQELFKNRSIKQLYLEIMRKLDSVFTICIVFGSYVKNTNTKSSDIDLLCISNDVHFEKKMHDVLSLLPLKVHLMVLTEKDFLRLKDSRKPNVVKEILNNYVVLYNIESFYQLKNA